MPLHAHHLVIGGFRQNRRRLAGVDRVLDALNVFRMPGVRVQLFKWDADWAGEAEFILRHKADADPIVCIYAYSWGFGHGAVRLAEELARRGLRVAGLVGCDGVYRDHFLLRRWRALWQNSRIDLPGSIDRADVRLFVQANSLLRGHRVFDAHGAEIRAERIERVVINGNRFSDVADHYNIDESARWIDECRCMARKFHPEAFPT